MSRVKNVSGGGLEVRAPGFERWVDDGEIVEVPDTQPDGESPLEWNPRQWQPVTAKEAKAAAKDDTTGKAAE
jgi:hypothetical protein